MRRATDSPLEFLGGFTAAEGCFTRSGAKRFRFSIGLGAIDDPMCVAFRDVLGVGQVRRYHRRKPHYDDEVQFTVQSTRELVEVIVPFMDAHLPASYKREQYLVWRAALLDHWEHRARRRKRCSEPGCDTPAKAFGWCREHLWVHRRE